MALRNGSLRLTLMAVVGLALSMTKGFAQPAAAQSSASYQGLAYIFGSVSEANALGENSCDYGPLAASGFPGFAIVGISPQSPLASTSMGGCGTCLSVRCSDTRLGACNTTTANVTVQIADRCLSCGPNDLNMHVNTFTQLAARTSLGYINISYSQVPCQPERNITVRVRRIRWEQGGYIKLALLDVAGPGGLTSVKLGGVGVQGAPKPFTNNGTAAWEVSGLPASKPALDLQLTDSAGRVLNIPNALPANAVPGDYPTTAQFPV